jgi:excisionase family DNA binding protein
LLGFAHGNTSVIGRSAAMHHPVDIAGSRRTSPRIKDTCRWPVELLSKSSPDRYRRAMARDGDVGHRCRRMSMQAAQCAICRSGVGGGLADHYALSWFASRLDGTDSILSLVADVKRPGAPRRAELRSIATITRSEGSPSVPIQYTAISDKKDSLPARLPYAQTDKEPDGRKLYPLLLTLPQAAEESGLTVWQIRGLIASGQLPVVKVGRTFYIRRATLLRWVERAEELVV